MSKPSTIIIFYIFSLQVKDMKEYEFEPASTVLDICRMYVELGNNERFCAAVSDDGRSYSPQLFTLAEAVLGTTILLSRPMVGSSETGDKYCTLTFEEAHG